MSDRNTTLKVRINTMITGEPAKWLLEWKRRGLVKSNTDAIIQAFHVLQERVVEQDLKSARLKTLEGEE